MALRSGPQQQPGRRPAANAGRIFNHYSTGAGMWVRVYAVPGPVSCTAGQIDAALMTPGIEWGEDWVGSPQKRLGLLHAVSHHVSVVIRSAASVRAVEFLLPSFGGMK